MWGNAFLLVKAAGAAVLAWVLAALGLRARAAVPRAVGGAADGARHRLPHVRPRRAAGRLRLPRGAARLRRRRRCSASTRRPSGSCCCWRWPRGRTRVLRDESTTAATTALVVLLAGYSSDTGMVGKRLLDTLIGIVVGLLVNLLVWPPLRDRAAARQVDVIDDRLGALLADIAARHARGPRGAGGRAVGRAHPRARPGHLRRLGRPAPGARERAAEPAPRRGGARRRLARPRAAARAPRAGGGRHAQHGRDDRRAPAGGGWDPGFRDDWLDLSGARAPRSATPTPSALTRVRADLVGRRRRAVRRRRGRPPAAGAGRAARQPAQHPRGDGRGRRGSAGRVGRGPRRCWRARKSIA